MTIYRIKDTPCFCIHIAEYTNGIETTAGFYSKEQLVKADGPISGITYTAEYCTELPVDWYDTEALDDRNKRLKIKEIKFGTKDPFVMEDGYRSTEVTI